MRIWLAVGCVLALLGAPESPGFAQRVGGAVPVAGPRSAAPAQPRQAQERTFFLANELGLALHELYVTPTGSVEPGTDLLGAETLPNGATLRISLGRQSLCLFDVRVVLADGTAQEKRGVDVCRGSRVTFGDPNLPLREAVVENATDLTLRELYAIPSARRQNSADRGPDRLTAEVLGPDSTFNLRLGRVRDCVYDLIGVFEDDSVEEKPRQDICRRGRVAFGDPSVPRRELEVANGAGRVMRSLLAAPPLEPGETRSQEQWGPDRLGGATLEAGDTFPMRLRSRACQTDLRATYDDDSIEEKRGVELCGGTGRVLFDGSGIARQPERAFVLVNRHSAAVEEAYASGTNDAEWGDDKLTGTLERGGRQEVVLHGGCEIDLRIVFGNGSAEERRGIDICATQLIVLRPDWVLAEKLDRNPGPIERAPPREGSVRLRNTGPSPIVELYVAPEGAPRGPDRLGATVLGQGEALDFQPPEGVGCIATLSAVFRDGREISRPGFNLCSGAEVALP